jgi:hypothetical protein
VSWKRGYVLPVSLWKNAEKVGCLNLISTGLGLPAPQGKKGKHYNCLLDTFSTRMPSVAVIGFRIGCKNVSICS